MSKNISRVGIMVGAQTYVLKEDENGHFSYPGEIVIPPNMSFYISREKANPRDFAPLLPCIITSVEEHRYKVGDTIIFHNLLRSKKNKKKKGKKK